MFIKMLKGFKHEEGFVITGNKNVYNFNIYVLLQKGIIW